MADSGIRLDTDYPVTIATNRPVRIDTVGDRVTVTIGPPRSRPSKAATAPASPDAAETGTETASPRRAQGPRCGRIMLKSGLPCARVEGHNGVCMHAKQVERKQRYNKNHARERYQSDPDYAEKVRAAQRAVSPSTAGEAPADES